MVQKFPHDGNLHLHVFLTDTSRRKTKKQTFNLYTSSLAPPPVQTSSSVVTFFADLAGEHAVTFARPSGHPGLVEDALLPSFDQIHQGQVGLEETRFLQRQNHRDRHKVSV